MIYYIRLNLAKKKLNKMIEKGRPYNKILKQSQKVDKLLNKKMRELYNL